MSEKLPERRSDCPISYALDFVGDRWTLIVLRDLILGGKRRFQEFVASNEKIASNILSNRLKLLERAGLVTRTKDPAHRRSVIYTPTEKGVDLLPIILELVHWGAKYDPKSAAPPQMIRRLAKDRDGFVAEVRAAHGFGGRRARGSAS
jgi:DNA-binding HxlR family transcriptional regulator